MESTRRRRCLHRGGDGQHTGDRGKGGGQHKAKALEALDSTQGKGCGQHTRPRRFREHGRVGSVYTGLGRCGGADPVRDGVGSMCGLEKHEAELRPTFVASERRRGLRIVDCY